MEEQSRTLRSASGSLNGSMGEIRRLLGRFKV
jgi:hypothetical protein